MHSLNVLGKVDHQISGADQLSVRYALYDVTSSNARGVGKLNAPSGSTGLDNLDQSIAVGNVLDALVEHRQRDAGPGGPRRPGGALHRSRSGRRSRSPASRPSARFSSSPTRRENTLFQVVNNLSHRAGAHALRAGVDFLYNDDTITFLRTFRGSYTFSSLANFLTGQLQRLRADVRQSRSSRQTNPNVGLYAQDEWRAGSRLT